MGRVVALLPPGADLSWPLSVELVAVASGYEAAAQLLCQPAEALLVDLSRLPAPHVPLLELAGRLHVPVIGFGTIMTSLPRTLLAGLHMTSQDQVAAVLEEVLAGVATPEEGAIAPPTTPQTVPPVMEPPAVAAPLTASPAAAPPLAVPRSPELAAVCPPAEVAAEKPRSMPAGAIPVARAERPPGRPMELLSPEEINALLEEKP